MSCPAPTRVRYGVLGFASALAMITYLDRACIASAADGFIKDLGLGSEAELNYALAAFTLAYALFEVPSGWLGDRFGPRMVLLRVVLWWSCFTAITGVIGLRVGGLMFGGMATLVVVRFLFGMGEAGAFPNITRALHNWFPVNERGRAQGVVWMSGRLMAGLTPLVWMILVERWHLHWRATFWIFGAVGLVWCVLFAVWFRNRPEEKPGVSDDELAYIRAGGGESEAAEAGIPWGRMLRSGNLWTLCLMYACQSYGWYFYMTYLPRFMQTQYGLRADDPLAAIYKGGPLWLGAVGCLTGGVLTDWFIRRTGNRRLGRRLFGAIGHGLTAICFLLCPWAPSAFWFFVAISLAGFSTDLAMGPGWAACQDIGKRYAAIVAGAMNMIGNFGGTLAVWVSGLILQRALDAHALQLGLASADELSAAEKTIGLLHGYHVNFFIFAAVYVIGFCCWLRIDATQPIVPEIT